MSLHRNKRINEFTISSAIAARRLRGFSLAALFVCVCLAPAQLVRADDEPMTPAQIEARIEELAGKDELTDAELAELVELGQRFADAVGEGAANTASPAPRATPTSRRPTPKPEASSSRRKGGVRATPTPTPTPRSRGRRTPPSRGGSRGRAPTPTPAPQVEAVEVEPNLAAEQFLKPYDQREYEFSLKDASYAQLLETFGRMSSLPVLGSAPEGDVTFVSSDVMDFKKALGRVQMLLFRHPDQYWLWFKQDQRVLEIVRVTEIKRWIPLNRIYTSLADYLQADLDDNEMALLLYTPETGSIAELEPLRDFMPDYFRTAPVPEKNAQTIFGLVEDINKYLALIDKFNISNIDPREIKIITVDYVKPSAAIATVQQLMDFGPAESSAAPARSRKRGQTSEAAVQAYGVISIPDDDRGTILVQAMPAKIEELEKLLKFVDVPLDNETGYSPVVVPVVNGDAGEVMNLVKSILAGTSGSNPSTAASTSAAARRRAAKRKKGGATPTAAAPLNEDGLTMLHWQPANSIILIGEDEEVAEARGLIERFDVAEEVETRLVELKHRSAAEACSLATELLTATQAGGAPKVTCKPEASDASVLLAGPTREVAAMLSMLEKIDINDGQPPADIFSMPLECMVPSQLVGILTAWDAADDSGAAAPVAVKKGKGRSRPRRTAATGKFQPDDATHTMRVICSAEEWEEDYKPLIVRLDHEACGDPTPTILTVNEISIDDAIGQLAGLLGMQNKAGGDIPTMLASPQGIMVYGATANDLAVMKELLTKIDVDPEKTGLVERRTFDLVYVEPSEIIPVLQALTGTEAAAAPKRGNSRRGKDAAPAVALDSGVGVSFVEYGSRLWVTAPPREMERIAALVEELDVADTERELRPYDFEAGANVSELAETLRQLFPANSRVAKSADGDKRRARRRATATATGDDAILFIPQPAMRRLFVSAPVAIFPEIEETIDMIRPTIDRQGVVVKFFDITKSSPSDVAEIVQPIIEIRVDEMIEAGEIPDPGKARDSLLKFIPQPSTSRLVVAAPNALFTEIESLIQDVQDGTRKENCTKTVRLEYATATDVAETIQAMMGETNRMPARAAATQGRRGRRRDNAEAAARSSQVVSQSGAKVIPLPSNDTLLISGTCNETEKVMEWIPLLDTEEVLDRVMRVYQPALADVEQLADDIMAVFDSSGVVKKDEGEGDFFDFSMGGPRVGQDIRLTTNYYTNTLIVWASPRLQNEIADYIDLYDTDPSFAEQALPSEMIPLKYADAYDAKYDLESFIDGMWSGEKPKIDYIPFKNVLVVKSRTMEKDLPQIKNIIAEYIDTPEKAGGDVIKREAIKGMPASDVVREVIMRLGPNVDVDVQGLEVDSRPSLLKTLGPPQYGSSEITPCVLPASIFAALDATLASATAQAEPAKDDEQKDDESAPPAEEVTPEEAAARAALLESLKQPAPDAKKPAEKKSDEKKPATNPTAASKDAKEDEPRPKVKISIDPMTNGLVIEGPSRAVGDIRAMIEDVVDERTEAGTGLPGIRVWQLEHVDPSTAAEVLEAMFGASTPGSRAAQAAQAARLRAQQQQQARQRAQQQQRQKQQQQQGDQQGKDGEQQRGGRDEQQQQDADAGQPQAPSPPNISVFPYPPLHAIIVKAPTEAFPAIEELVATIDRKMDATSDFRYFQVRNQAASSVEEQLKVIFNIDQSSQRTRQTRGRGNAAGQQAQQMMENQIDLAGLGDEAGALGSTASITITSNDTTNTVLVRGPNPVLDLAEKIIDKIEENAPAPIETRTFPLQYADVSNIVPQLKELFSAGKDQEFHPDNVQAIFLADTLNNAVIVKARTVDFERIKGVLEQIDVQTGPAERAVTVEVTCGDAEQFAKLLEKIYGMGRRGAESGKKAQFVGDPSSNTIVFTAPEEVREEITKRIADMDVTACNLAEPKFIKLINANASQVATVIEEAFGGGKGSKSRVRVAGDDTTRQVVVQCPDQIFPKIEQFARTLDVPPTDLDVRTFKLQYAKASETLRDMETMFRSLAQQLVRKGVPLDAFAGTASDRANTITVAGGPITFAAVEKFLGDVDVESEDTTPTTLVIPLEKTEADDVARTIRNLFPRPENGIEPPRVDANSSTNTIIVRGTKAQLDRINSEVIQKLEEFADPDQKRITQVYRVANADLNSVSRAITTSFRLERGAAESERVDVATDDSTQSIIVTAKPAKQEEVAKLIQEIDVNRDTTAVRTTHVVPLKNANAEDLARRLTDIINRTQPRRGGGQNMAVVADPGTNNLLVYANEGEMKELTDLINTLDLPATFEPEIHSFKLMFADAGSTREAIVQLFGTRRGQNVSPRDQVSAVVEWGSNSVVVSAAKDNMEKIAEFVEQVDKMGEGGRKVHVVNLESADADAVVRSLRELFVKRGRRGEESVSITSPPGSNAILISATDQEFEEINTVIARLDTTTAEEERVTKVHRILRADINSVRNAVATAFRMERGTAESERVDVATEPATQSVIVTAKPAKQEEISKLIAEIENDIDTNSLRSTHVLTLKEANAEDLARRLTDVINRTQPRRGGGQNMAVVADPGTNNLLVYANEQELTEMKELIATLDIPPSFEPEIKSFKLTFAEAGPTREAIVQLFGTRRGQSVSPREQVSAVVEWASNSVVVSAAKDNMEKIAAFINDIDQIGQGGRQVHVITLTNA
ncbi:MAG: hypothetical protein H6817_07750, partial [Phycisphaerales bacterium]|nr:hypothetical protein [Phycisphaerales bacterium]